MKCVRCGHDSNYPQRSKKTCPGCQGKFAFEPREGDPLSDAAFQNALDAVSGKGRLHFLEGHLYHDLLRRAKRPAVPAVVPLLLLSFTLGCGVLALQFSGGFLVPGAVLLFLTIVTCVHYLRSGRPKLSAEVFRTMLRRWCEVHGRPETLIRTPLLAGKRPDAEADLGDYSFDRAVICDRPEYVDFLVANQFHFENNCAVLTADGYPEGPFEMVRGMLQRNPELLVIAVHDATVQGCAMPQRLATDPAWFGDAEVPIREVGLRPGQASAFPEGVLPAEGARLSDVPGVSESEAQWLSRHTLSLCVIKPDQLLKRLFAALNRKPHPESADYAGSGADGSSGAAGGMPMPLIIPIGLGGDPKPPADKAGDGAGAGGEANAGIIFDSESLTKEATDTDAGDRKSVV